MTCDPFQIIIFNFRDSYSDGHSPFLKSDPNAIPNQRGLFFFRKGKDADIYYFFSPDNFKYMTLTPITLDSNNFLTILHSLQDISQDYPKQVHLILLYLLTNASQIPNPNFEIQDLCSILEWIRTFNDPYLYSLSSYFLFLKHHQKINNVQLELPCFKSSDIYLKPEFGAYLEKLKCVFQGIYNTKDGNSYGQYQKVFTFFPEFYLESANISIELDEVNKGNLICRIKNDYFNIENQLSFILQVFGLSSINPTDCLPDKAHNANQLYQFDDSFKSIKEIDNLHKTFSYNGYMVNPAFLHKQFGAIKHEKFRVFQALEKAKDEQLIRQNQKEKRERLIRRKQKEKQEYEQLILQFRKDIKEYEQLIQKSQKDIKEPKQLMKQNPNISQSIEANKKEKRKYQQLIAQKQKEITRYEQLILQTQNEIRQKQEEVNEQFVKQKREDMEEYFVYSLSSIQTIEKIFDNSDFYFFCIVYLLLNVDEQFGNLFEKAEQITRYFYSHSSMFIFDQIGLVSDDDPIIQTLLLLIQDRINNRLSAVFEQKEKPMYDLSNLYKALADDGLKINPNNLNNLGFLECQIQSCIEVALKFHLREKLQPEPPKNLPALIQRREISYHFLIMALKAFDHKCQSLPHDTSLANLYDDRITKLRLLKDDTSLRVLFETLNEGQVDFFTRYLFHDDSLFALHFLPFHSQGMVSSNVSQQSNFEFFVRNSGAFKDLPRNS